MYLAGRCSRVSVGFNCADNLNSKGQKIISQPFMLSTWTVSHLSHDSCFHTKCLKAVVMAFVAHDLYTTQSKWTIFLIKELIGKRMIFENRILQDWGFGKKTDS